MKSKFDFFRTTLPESRKADFHLGCLNGSVFIDFNYTTTNQINICRISFDDYGCCNIENAKHLDEQLSNEFIKEISRDNLDQEKITELILELVRLNKDKIWDDALEKYKLIDM
jgi:hypothetical protein